MLWIQELLTCLREFNTVSCVFRLLIAALLGGAIGLERERHGRAAGLRTHILVCIGATTAVVAGLFVSYRLGFSNDPLRAGAQVISGIGFLGAGTILMRDGNHVVGLTTAAGLWTTAAIGLLVGTGFYALAVVATGIVIAAMVLLGKTEAQKRRRNRSRRFYLEVQDVEHVQPLVDIPNIDRVQIVAARSGLPEQVGLYITLGPKRDPSGDDAFRETLLGFAGVAFVMPDTDDF